MGYNPVPDEQWTPDDLARAEAAKDLTAINKARRSGHLHTILNPPAEASDPARIAAALGDPAPVLPTGPTVAGQQPGGSPQGNAGPVPMTQAELDALAADSNWAEINRARRAGRLTNLGAGNGES